MTAAEAISSIQQDIANLNRLRREIGMLRQIQPNLGGIPARHNLKRIADREAEVAELMQWLNRVDAAIA